MSINDQSPQIKRSWRARHPWFYLAGVSLFWGVIGGLVGTGVVWLAMDVILDWWPR